LEKKKPFNLSIKGLYTLLNAFCGELGFRTISLYALLTLFFGTFFETTLRMTQFFIVLPYGGELGTTIEHFLPFLMFLDALKNS
jgi:hypothetical protein